MQTGASLQKAYAQFGISAPTTPMDFITLLQLLAAAEASFVEVPCDLSPTSFDPRDPGLAAFPRPLKWRWSSVERALILFRSRGILMRLPLFWQVEPALFRAGQTAGAPLFVNDQDNMPVGLAAIRDAFMDTVVTDAADAEHFARYLATTAVSPRAWIIVHPLLAPQWQAPHFPSTTLVAQEVHLFPGVTLLSQCAQLLSQREPLFHLEDRWTLEENRITSVADDPLPLMGYTLGTKLAPQGTCACGKTILSR